MTPEKTSRIFLAHDGSINSDWVSRYAIRIAANAENKKLFLLHILDNTYTAEQIRLKIKAIEDECIFQHVELGHAILPFSENVFKTIMESIPHGRENFCICGSRITSRGKGFLTGTISEKLLRANKFNVLAIRVVHPGLLGCPRDIMIPLVGKKVRYEATLPFYQLLAPDIQQVHFLRVVPSSPWLLPYRSTRYTKNVKKRGFEFIKEVMEVMKQPENSSAIHFDGRVVISSDWVLETLVHASRRRARLIMLEGASPFAYRWLWENKIEKILRNTTCDVALFRKV